MHPVVSFTYEASTSRRATAKACPRDTLPLRALTRAQSSARLGAVRGCDDSSVPAFYSTMVELFLDVARFVDE
jgi:hypothetical protein